jgi:hypothetical protein
MASNADPVGELGLVLAAGGKQARCASAVVPKVVIERPR